MDCDSISAIVALLQTEGIALKKRWGQNFLVDSEVVRRMMNAINDGRVDSVWEIGAGLGALTQALLAAGYRVIAFEIDHGLCRILRRRFGSQHRFRLVEGDALSTCLALQEEESLPDLVVGNLPYRSAAKLLSLVRGFGAPPPVVAMMQLEAARRLQASPGARLYSGWSVLLQSCYRIRSLFEVPAGGLFPRPHVRSTVVELRPRDDLLPRVGLHLLEQVLFDLFRSRRQTIRNNLLHGERVAGLGHTRLFAACGQAGIPLNARAEAISVEGFLRLAHCLAEGESGT